MKQKKFLFFQYALLMAGILLPIFLLHQWLLKNVLEDRTILLRGTWVEAMTIDNNDRLWLATFDGVKMIEGSEISSFDIGQSEWATEIGIDENGEVWAIVGSGVIGKNSPAEIYKFDGKDWVFQKKIDSAHPYAVARTNPFKNELPCCLPSDETKVSDAEFAKYSPFIAIDFDSGDNDLFLKDRQGNMWAGTRQGLVHFSSDFRISPSFFAFHRFTSSGGFWLLGLFITVFYSASLLYKYRSFYNVKDVFISARIGFGIAIVTFLISTFLIGAVGLFLVGQLMPSCWESCPLAVIFFSPILGGIIAVISGIVSGSRKYKNIRKENNAAST